MLDENFSTKRIYLDVCVLSRPYDDQTQKRIRLETSALALIINDVDRSLYEMIVSPVHQAEIGQVKDVEKRRKLAYLLQKSGTRLSFDATALQDIRTRAENLANLGMGDADAAHIAFAEASQAYFVTTDDRLLKQ